MPKNRNRIIKKCRQCKNSFEVIKCRELTALYCSRECKTKYVSINGSPLKKYPVSLGKNCNYCGKEIIITYSGLNKPTRKFCSHRCSTIVKNKNMVWTDEMRAKMATTARNTFTGRKQSEEEIKKRARSISGKNHWNWRGGITAQHFRERNNWRLKKWRRLVFKRDNYTCQICGVRGGKLNADHIKAWALYPKLRYKLSNGRTLCVPCHKKTDNFCGKVRIK